MPAPAASRFARGVVAQIIAETLSRLRSTGTIITVLLLFAAAFTYVPPPDAHQASILWQSGTKTYSGTYTAGFVGAMVALITAMLLPLPGFYLVAGSVRRDLERRVWPILAATPTSSTTYLLGKWLAAWAYLLVLAALALLPAVFLFLRYGTGPLVLSQLFVPWLLLTPPAMACTAAFALLFDVTPGLSGRGGYVLWFFTFSFLFIMVPAILGGRLDDDRSNDRSTSYDPAGLVLFQDLVARSVDAPVHSISLGLIVTEEPITRVPFAPLRVDEPLLARRASTLAWAGAPLLAALAIFPLAAGRGLRPPRQRGVVASEEASGAPAGVMASTAGAVRWRSHAGQPRFAGSVLAEALLIWQAASWLKWPLALAAGLTLFLPTVAAQVTIAIFLLLLAPTIAEAAAREELAGTSATVFAQPGVPRSAVTWKLAAVGSFVGAVGAPVLLRSLLRGGSHGLAMLLALAFIVAGAVGIGWLSRGGKLFLGIFTALWYVAVQQDSPLDFAGAFTARPDLALCAGYAAAGAAAAGLALVVERWRNRRGRTTL